MTRKRKQYPIGSVISGTMKPEDLIPCFCNVLKEFARKSRNKYHMTLLMEIEQRQKEMEDNGNDYYCSTESVDDLDALFDALNEYAAPYFYFGANEGDGADYGFWLSENWLMDTDALRVGDLSEVPRDYVGEVFVINDHGNISYYIKARTQEPRAIWAIV